MAEITGKKSIEDSASSDETCMGNLLRQRHEWDEVYAQPGVNDKDFQRRVVRVKKMEGHPDIKLLTPRRSVMRFLGSWDGYEVL